MNLPIIRRAEINDALGIHEAHMRSIRELCSNDYNEVQILAWGGRKFNEEFRQKFIRNDLVWIVELNGKIAGYCHLIVDTEDSFGEIMALYLTPEVVSKGYGKRMLQLVEDEAKKLKIRKIQLNSTLTSKEFYLSQGYSISRSQFCVQINKVDVECIPMEKKLIY